MNLLLAFDAGINRALLTFMKLIRLFDGLRSDPERGRRVPDLLLCGLMLMGWAGCATPPQTAALAVAGATVVGAQVPSNEVEQMYYLGVFDPEEQLPPTIYRVTVRGQASFLSGTKFGSGWVPASIIDSLNGQVSADPYGAEGIQVTPGTQSPPRFKLDRRLVLFGPEGFREAPRDHRLVIVMGASPKAWFDAVDQALADSSSVSVERGNQQVQKQLLDELERLQSRREPIAGLERRILEEIR